MGNVLEFTLGLQVNKFLEGMNLGAGSIISMAKVSEGLKVVMEGVWGQIERGAALSELSRRTGESVGTLFQLQKGFKAAGLGAEDVGVAMYHLNKSLGGLNEMGEKTGDIFKQAGLSVGDLKKAGGAGSMTAVLEKMSKMSQTSATKFASSVFGRGEAANMVQLSRSMDEFRDGMKRAAAQAEVFERVAKVFHVIEKAVERVKAKLDPVFLVIAEHIAPAIEKVLAMVNDFDLSPLVNGIGDAFDTFSQAFEEGKVMELLVAGFGAAVEYMGDLITGVLGSSTFWKGIFDEMLGEFILGFAVIAKLFLNLGVILKAALVTAFEVVLEWIGKIPVVGEKLGLGGYKADKFGDNYAEEKDKASGANEMVDGWIKAGAEKTLGGRREVLQSLADAHANAGGPQQDQFNDLVNGLLGRKRAKEGGKKGKTKEGGDEALALGGGHQVQATGIEKMGFVFGGGMATDHNATTARNTTKMVEQLGQLVAGKASGNDFGGELTNGHAA